MCCWTAASSGMVIVGSRESLVSSLNRDYRLSTTDYRLLGSGCLRLLRELGKRRWTGDGELGEVLAVERYAGGLEAAHQLAVREAVLPRGGVDADDPQTAEVALLAAAADERVLQRGIDRLFRGPIQLALVGVIALGEPQKLFALRPPDCSSFNSWHSSLPTLKLQNGRM